MTEKKKWSNIVPKGSRSEGALLNLNKTEPHVTASERPQILKNRISSAIEKNTQKRYKRGMAVRSGSRTLAGAGLGGLVSLAAGMVAGNQRKTPIGSTKTPTTIRKEGRQGTGASAAGVGASVGAAVASKQGEKKYVKTSSRVYAKSKAKAEKKFLKGKLKI